jgi:kojibiose phosphorylase
VVFERFASLADPHALFIRCRVIPEFAGILEFRPALNGTVDNDGLVHWHWVDQGIQDGMVYLHTRTRRSGITLAYAMRVTTTAGKELARAFWDTDNRPTVMVQVEAVPGQEIVMDKQVAVYTSRDVNPDRVVSSALSHVTRMPMWENGLSDNAAAWAREWERSDVIIEGDEDAQVAVRFNLFQLLIAAPRNDDRVSIGARTLSGFGYRGHTFWDTEIFMLPLFAYTAPSIARNLLTYRYRLLPAARRKAQANGFEGAQFPWESAETGDEVTPTWVPHTTDRSRLVRIWTGDIEIHISADIAYAAYSYWQVTGDDDWLIDEGAELILDTAKFWASRAEWNAQLGRYEYNDVIGPDEYHEHVNNNAFTNRMAQWNVETALHVLEWLKVHAPAKAAELIDRLDLSHERLAHWRDVRDKIYLPIQPSGLIEQFDGYFQRTDVDLAALEPRTRSVQEIFGIAGANERQAIKQPDVLMMLYLLRDEYPPDILRVNYDYYNPRTDHTYGSSLGPAIHAIVASELGMSDDAYSHFMRAARADLDNVRGNTSEGIHGASAGGVWQAVVFGFAGLRVSPSGWTVRPRLPRHWTRLAFRFFHRGKPVEIDLTQPVITPSTAPPGR